MVKKFPSTYSTHPIPKHLPDSYHHSSAVLAAAQFFSLAGLTGDNKSSGSLRLLLLSVKLL